MEQTTTLVETITRGIQEKKGANIVVANLNGIDGAICNYFIICQGNSPMQVQAITDSVEEFAWKETHEKPVHIVGQENAVWVAMDYTDVMVHIFVPDMREYYNLENLWEDAPLERVPDID
jgi:ribosome-associated protein